MNQIPMQLSTSEGTTSTGSIRLDFALQHGGLRPGSIVLIHGEEDSGKTLLSLKMVIHACQSGKPAAFIDSDGTFDTSFGIRYGVDPRHLYISRFYDPHEVLEIAALLSISGCFSMVTIDSIDPLLEDDEQGILVHENLLNVYLPRIFQSARRNGTTLVFTQHRNPWIRRIYHELKTQIPRLSFAFNADIHLETSSPTEEPATIPGSKTIEISILKGKKNGVQIPLNMVLMYNHSIERCEEILVLGEQLGSIHIQDGHYIFRDQRLGCNRQESIRLLAQNNQLAEVIEQDIRISLGTRSGV